MQDFPVWTLAAANAVLPEVVRLTDEAVAQLREIEAVWGKLPFQKFDTLSGVAAADMVRARWAHGIAALGVMPKGFFVADFQSEDPDTVYCWGYGEDKIEHEHKVWETFVSRRPIQNAEHLDETSWDEN